MLRYREFSVYEYSIATECFANAPREKCRLKGNESFIMVS
jgi:hypothetical protein